MSVLEFISWNSGGLVGYHAIINLKIPLSTTGEGWAEGVAEEVAEGGAEGVAEGGVESTDWVAGGFFLGVVLNPANALLIKFAAVGLATLEAATAGVGGTAAESLVPEISGIQACIHHLLNIFYLLYCIMKTHV